MVVDTTCSYDANYKKCKCNPCSGSAPVILIPMHKLQPKVMLPTEAAKAVLKQNISAKKTPAQVTQLANAAAKSAPPSAIVAPLKSLRVAKNAAMILALPAGLIRFVLAMLLRPKQARQNVVTLAINAKIQTRHIILLLSIWLKLLVMVLTDVNAFILEAVVRTRIFLLLNGVRHNLQPYVHQQKHLYVVKQKLMKFRLLIINL